MKRKHVLMLAALGFMASVAWLELPRRTGTGLRLLEWAAKAPAETPPVAILLEMGLKDIKPASWSGQATVAGAKVVRREGYRFRANDKLVDADAWQAGSHRPIRLPPQNLAL